MTEIKNIIFDIGNVLTRFGWKEYFAGFGYSEEVQHKIQKATVESVIWREYDRGVWTDEEILKGFIRNDPSIETELRESLTDIHGMISRLDYAIPWILALKKSGHNVYYLSNFSRKAHTDCLDAMDFLQYTDGGILSYLDRVIKPDPAIYELLLSRYQLNAEECVFLDDTADNLPTAQQLGMKTILFRSREQAVSELKDLGVVSAC